MASQCMASALADAATGARQTSSLNRSIFSSHHRPTCRSKCHPPVLTCVRPGAATGALDFGRWEGECHPLTRRPLLSTARFIYMQIQPPPRLHQCQWATCAGRCSAFAWPPVFSLSSLCALSSSFPLNDNWWGCACHLSNTKDTHWRADRSKYLCGCQSPIQYRPLAQRPEVTPATRGSQSLTQQPLQAP